jgi:hypothetical protein
MIQSFLSLFTCLFNNPEVSYMRSTTTRRRKQNKHVSRKKTIIYHHTLESYIGYVTNAI